MFSNVDHLGFYIFSINSNFKGDDQSVTFLDNQSTYK